MKNVLIFGSSGMYIQHRDFIEDNYEIIGFLDNDPNKIGTKVDGFYVYAPDKINEINESIDLILIASIYYTEIFTQLVQLNVYIPVLSLKAATSLHNTDVTLKTQSETENNLASYCTGEGLHILQNEFSFQYSKIHNIKHSWNQKNHKKSGFIRHLYETECKLPWFFDNSLDYIYSDILSYFSNSEEILMEWFRVIKPDGVLALYIPDVMQYRSFCAKNGVMPNKNLFNFDFNLNTVKAALVNIQGTMIIHEQQTDDLYCFELVIKKG